jgi:peptidoglycan pentaglycine glycine transferase (the first glycine)
MIKSHSIMQVRVLTENDRVLWDAFVSKQKDPMILQSFEWGQFKVKNGWGHFILAVEDNGAIIAGISILTRKLPVIKKVLFYAPRGPICDMNNDRSLKTLLDGVKIEASLRNALALKIDPEIEESAEISKLLKANGFIHKKKQVQPRSTYFLDLTKPLDELLKSFEEKTRYNIRLAERKGVTVTEESNQQGIESFYKIYLETCKRDAFLIHPISYYTKLRDTLIENGMANVFTAKINGLPIASIYVFRFGDRVWYMYGASSNEYRNVMPNHALHWHLIKWAKEKGYKMYDMWGIPANPKPGHPLHGVWRFKKGFNGQLKTWTGVWDMPFDKLSYHLFDKGLGYYQAIRSLLTKGRIVDSLSE